MKDIVRDSHRGVIKAFVPLEMVGCLFIGSFATISETSEEIEMTGETTFCLFRCFKNLIIYFIIFSFMYKFFLVVSRAMLCYINNCPYLRK